MTTRISDQASTWIEKALLAYPGERVDFDVTVIPGDQNGMPVFFVVLFLPGAAIGDRLHVAAQTGNVSGVTEAMMTTLIHQMVEGGLQARTQALQDGAPGVLVSGGA